MNRNKINNISRYHVGTFCFTILFDVYFSVLQMYLFTCKCRCILRSLKPELGGATALCFAVAHARCSGRPRPPSRCLWWWGTPRPEGRCPAPWACSWTTERRGWRLHPPPWTAPPLALQRSSRLGGKTQDMLFYCDKTEYYYSTVTLCVKPHLS